MWPAILFVSYYCGGYVAGRIAKFNGAKKGFMVWLWAIIMALLGNLAGERFNIFADLNTFPRLVALVGAVLGGLAGMRFHRNVDKAGFAAAAYAADADYVGDERTGERYVDDRRADEGYVDDRTEEERRRDEPRRTEPGEDGLRDGRTQDERPSF